MVSRYMIAMALMTIGIIVLIMQLALRARRRPIVSGREELIGSQGTIVIIKGDEERPRVRIRGELWQIRSYIPLKNGQCVQVTGIEDLVLIVRPAAVTQTDKEL